MTRDTSSPNSSRTVARKPTSASPVRREAAAAASATSRPAAAMKTHEQHKTPVEAANPAPAVAAGNASTPAPTVVPAMSAAAEASDMSAAGASAASTTGVASCRTAPRWCTMRDDDGDCNACDA